MDCQTSGCSSKIFSRLLCRKHYEQERRSNAAPCSFSGCQKPADRAGLCMPHYRAKMAVDYASCGVPGCGQKVATRNATYCAKHALRMRAHGAVEATRPSDWGAREKHPLYKSWVWHKRKANGLVPQWVEDFWAFAGTIGERPAGHTLRKVRPEQPLGPDNWQWQEAIPSADKAAYSREWARKNPERAKSITLKKMYGITLAEYDRMLEAQGGVCAVCKRPERARGADGAPRQMPVDHCHKTGRVRGLLCTSCNRALGMMEDNVVALQSAIDYLLRHGTGIPSRPVT